MTQAVNGRDVASIYHSTIDQDRGEEKAEFRHAIDDKADQKSKERLQRPQMLGVYEGVKSDRFQDPESQRWSGQSN